MWNVCAMYFVVHYCLGKSLLSKLCITCLEVRINCRQFSKKGDHVINVSGLNLAENVLLLLHRELLNIFNLVDEMDIKVHYQLKDKPEQLLYGSCNYRQQRLRQTHV